MGAFGQNTPVYATVEHHGRSIGGELATLSGRLAVMSGLAEAQLAEAVAALAARDSETAQRVVNGDSAIDDMETEINARAMRLLTLHAPVAADLREIVGALKISANVERIGDYAANIAKRCIIVNGSRWCPPTMVLLNWGASCANTSRPLSMLMLNAT